MLGEVIALESRDTPNKMLQLTFDRSFLALPLQSVAVKRS